MSNRTAVAAVLALAALSACSNPSTRPDAELSPAEPPSPSGATTRPLTGEELVSKRLELATPGPEHAELGARAGRWDVDFRYRAGPEAPWIELRGSITARSVLGGRYLLEEHALDVGGPLMQGLLLQGFDNESLEYTRIWLDSGSTWCVDARGRKSADGTITLHGTTKDANGERPYRVVERAISADEHETELHERVDGREELVMAYTARRAR